MELNSAITTIITAFIVSFLTPLALAWAKHRLTEQTAGREKTESAVMELVRLEFDHILLERHVDDLESLLRLMVARIRDGKTVSEIDLFHIEREMQRRPRRRKEV